ACGIGVLTFATLSLSTSAQPPLSKPIAPRMQSQPMDSRRLATEQLKGVVFSRIKAQWAKDPRLANIRYVSFDLVHRTGDLYIGYLKTVIVERDSQILRHLMTFEVMYDGETISWTTKELYKAVN